ncbi:MAG: chromophore lyase CpcT/CpeT [Polyangiales bacterium]
MNALRPLAWSLALLGCGATPSPSSSPDAAPAADVSTVDAATDVPAADVSDAPAVDITARVYAALLGRFDSRAQSIRDPQYFAIQLLTCEISVPDLGPRVMYVEQARMDALDAPYRQRLYVVEAEEGGVSSRVFEFNNPAMVRGLCADPASADVRPKDLVERAGCAVHLRAVGDHFEGGTRGQECESTLMGASYATSEVILRDDGLESWDRGFNSQGRQVWGATAGAYVFQRRAP